MSKQNNTSISHQQKPRRNKKLWIIISAVLLVLFMALVGSLIWQAGDASNRYEDTDNTEVAAFEMQLNYQANCDDQQNCDADSPRYDFLVFVFDEAGRQIRIVRGSDDGVYKASLPEGSYTLLTSKAFEGIEGLPQEQVELQNGKVLKLEVDYGKAKSSKKEGGE